MPSKSETFSMKTIVKELGFLKKKVIALFKARKNKDYFRLQAN